MGIQYAKFEAITFVEPEGPTEASTPLINPRTLSDEARRDLLERIDRREVLGVRFQAVAFEDAPNRNGIRLPRERFAELAALVAGSPLITNHSDDARDVAGRNARSFVQTLEGAPDRIIVESMITHPEEMAAFVRGERLWFSISFASDRWACPTCEKAARAAAFGPAPACGCGVGIEAVGRLEFIHQAMVTDPAVQSATVIDPVTLGFKPINTQRVTMGTVLAGKLKEALESLVESSDTDRAGVIAAVADRAESDAEAVEAALDGSAACPTLAVLRAFADVLDADLELLVEGAREDGCEYDLSPEEEEAPEMADKTKEGGAAAELAAVRAQLKASEQARLKMAFDAKVREGACEPARFARFKKIHDGMGIDFALEEIASLKASGATPSQPVGFDSTEYTEPGTASKGDEWFLAENAVKTGHRYTRTQLDAVRNGDSMIRHPLFKRN